MHSHNEILRFQEGVRSQHPTPETSVASAPPGKAQDAGEQLIVLVDLAPHMPHRSREIRASAINTYWASSGSIVARLRRALAEANRRLARVNSNASPGTKCSGNITCAVLSGKELFLGQIGAAYAFVWHPDDSMEVFPQRNRLLIPLGGTLPPVIHIGYTVLEQDSTLLMATTPAAEVQARERWKEMLAAPTVADIVERITDTMAQHGVTGSLALMQMQADIEPVSQAQPPARRVWSLFKRRKKTAAPATPVATAPLPLIEAPDLQPEEPRIEAALSEPEILPEAITSPSLDEANLRPLFTHPVAEPDPATPLPAFLQRRMRDQSLLAEDDGDEQSRKPRLHFELPRLQLPSLQEWKDRLARRKQDRRYKERRTTAERARLRHALRALLPGKVEGIKQDKIRSAPKEKITVMVGLVLGLTLFVTFFTLSIYMQFGGRVRAEELLVTARAVREVAYTRQMAEDWYRLLELSTQIVTIDPQNSEAAELKEKAVEAIDILEHAVVLDTVPLLDLGIAPKPRRLLVAERWVYVLNTATDEVIGLQLADDYVTALSDAPTSILKRGQTFYGEPVEHLVDLAWIRPGGIYPDGAVFIYSDGGTLYIYEPVLGPGGITRQLIQGNLQPGMVTLMTAVGEKFYLVQRQENQILTYEPINGLYDLPRGYFSPGTAPYLQEALELAVDERVYLLMGDGTVRAYFEGTEDPSFEISGLPDPELKPIVLATEPDSANEYIYLGDSLHGCIVVLSQRGDFMHQFRLPGEALQQLEAIAVNQNPRVLYLITENRLYAAPLPDFAAQ